jgi:Protein of unknown function (DUF3375)
MMDYRTLETLRRSHPGWRLLVADHAPLLASFLHDSFIQPNIRAYRRLDLVSRLDDHLYRLREQLGEATFPRSAQQYLDDWAADERAWLRKYYPPNDDEPHYDLTPAAEKAIDWLVSLGQRQFVGTESRLMAVFDLLRQVVEATEADPEARIAELEKRKAQIEADIGRIRDGHVVVMDATQVKDRFQLMATTARGLLSDFREVEQNFRNLDRDVRARIANWDAGKGALLEDIFGQRDIIADSDQGKSFRAFWDFLMSPARQEELTALLQAVFAIEAVQDLAPDRRLLRIHYDWLEAGEVAQRTVARLSEQLRRFLDDQAWLENRRIMHLIRAVEQHALAIRDQPPEGPFLPLDEAAPDIELAMDRPLFTPPFKPRFSDETLVAGEGDISAEALFDQHYVDKPRLAAQIRRALQTASQVSLADLVAQYPIEQGLAELVTYLSLAAEDRLALIDDSAKQTVSWTDAEGVHRQATLPRVIFTRRAA